MKGLILRAKKVEAISMSPFWVELVSQAVAKCPLNGSSRFQESKWSGRMSGGGLLTDLRGKDTEEYRRGG